MSASKVLGGKFLPDILFILEELGKLSTKRLVYFVIRPKQISSSELLREFEL